MITMRKSPPSGVHRKWQSILKPHTDFIASLRPFNTYQEIADKLKEHTDGKLSVTRSTVYKFCKVRNITNGYGRPSLRHVGKHPTKPSSGSVSALEEAKRRISAQLAEAEKENNSGDELTVLTDEEARRLKES